MEEFNKICRICLSCNNSLSPIFENDESTETNVAELLNKCFDYKILPLDGLPQNICENCKKFVYKIFEFQRLYAQSYHRLSKNSMVSSENQNSVSFQHFSEKYTQTDNVMLTKFESRSNAYNICNESIDKSDDLTPNILQIDVKMDKKLENQCQICNRHFTKSEHMRRHLAIIHKIVDCEPNIANQPIDITIVDDLGLNNFINDKLNISNNEDDMLLDYIENIDNEIQDEVSLSVAHESGKKINDNIPELIDKQLEMLKNNDAEISCNMCTKKFKKFILLRKHMKARHNTIDVASHNQSVEKLKDILKIPKCKICHKTFSTKVYLQRHYAIHERKRYVCKECAQDFITKEELNAHVKAEKHDKPLLCPECGLRCKTSNILMVHLRRHKGEKPYKCKFCTKGFPRMDDLRVHEKYHTGEKSHFCETCGKGFQRKYNLTIHLRIHTGEKPYKCPHCPQAFAQGNDLKAHIRRHTGERFRCDHCDAAFLQGYQVRQHKLNEHGIKEDPPIKRVEKFISAEAQKNQIEMNLK